MINLQSRIPVSVLEAISQKADASVYVLEMMDNCDISLLRFGPSDLYRTKRVNVFSLDVANKVLPAKLSENGNNVIVIDLISQQILTNNLNFLQFREELESKRYRLIKLPEEPKWQEVASKIVLPIKKQIAAQDDISQGGNCQIL